MTDYELTVILKKDEAKALAEIISKVKAKVASKKDIEKKSFAYEIDKQKEGFYAFFELEMEPAMVSELEQKLKLQDDVIRYLIVKK